MYLAKPDVQALNLSASAKMAKIQFAKRRHDRHLSSSSSLSYSPSPNGMNPSRYDAALPPVPPPSNPLAVELPAEDVAPPPKHYREHSLGYQHMGSVADMKYTVVSADEWPQPLNITHSQQQYQHRPSMDSPHDSNTSLHDSPSSPARHSVEYRHGSSGGEYRATSDYRHSSEFRPSSSHQHSPPAFAAHGDAPPLPPKTPLNGVD